MIRNASILVLLSFFIFACTFPNDAYAQVKKSKSAFVMTRLVYPTIEPRVSKALVLLKPALRAVADYPKQHRHINKL